MSSRITWTRAAAAVAAIAIAVGTFGAGAGAATPAVTYSPKFDPASFVAGVTNPYFPLVPGARWVYAGTTDAGKERVEVQVTGQIETILGVASVVVRDDAFVDGKLIEQTFDWYAQDRDGNVWYMGEDSDEVKDGKRIPSKGSWKAGVDGAEPGIIMPARPEPGQTYRQELYKGYAEDMATVVGVHAKDVVPWGAFRDGVKTKDFTPLEPKLVEFKYYAPDVGIVLEHTVKGGFGRLELITYTTPQSEAAAAESATTTSTSSG